MCHVSANLHQHHWSWAQYRSAETWPVGCRDVSFCTPPIVLSLVVSDVRSYPWSKAPCRKSVIFVLFLLIFQFFTSVQKLLKRTSTSISISVELNIRTDFVKPTKIFGTYLMHSANATKAHKARISFIVLTVTSSLHSITYCTVKDFSLYIQSYHVSYHEHICHPGVKTHCA